MHNFDEIFEASFASYFEALHRYAFTILKSNDLACDAVQTTFLKWWDARTLIEDREEVRRYLYKSVYRTSLNIIRDEKTRSLHEDQFQKVTPVAESQREDFILAELDERIQHAIQQLPPVCKLVFIKSRYEEKRYQDIAIELNVSVKTVESHMGKALRILRDSLEKFDVVPITSTSRGKR